LQIFSIFELSFVPHGGWRIRLWKITRIPRYGPTCIVARPRCTFVSLSFQLIGGCHKCGYGPGDGIRHPTSFVANPRFEAMLQSMEMIVDKSVEYNVLRLAQHENSMDPNGVPRVCLIREHNLIHQFQKNSLWFSHSRHVTSKISRRILMSDLGNLSLRSLAKQRDELESCWCAVEIYGMIFESFTHIGHARPIGCR
jgi:hypothetical protein